MSSLEFHGLDDGGGFDRSSGIRTLQSGTLEMCGHIWPVRKEKQVRLVPPRPGWNDKSIGSR